LLIEGSGTDAAGTIWDQAERVVSTRLARVEARAALAQAARIGRISARQLESSKHELDGLLIQPNLVELTTTSFAEPATLPKRLRYAPTTPFTSQPPNASSTTIW